MIGRIDIQPDDVGASMQQRVTRQLEGLATMRGCNPNALPDPTDGHRLTPSRGRQRPRAPVRGDRKRKSFPVSPID